MSDITSEKPGVLPPRQMREVVIGLGSNWEGAAQLVERAIARLRSENTWTLRGVSRLRRTRAIGGPVGQNDFVNAVAVLEIDLPAEDLLARLHILEEEFGRQRAERWAPRTLDLDILLDQAGPICHDRLLVPHPRLAARRFFLESIGEIDPRWWHFWSGLSVGGLLRGLRDTAPWLIVVCETFVPPAMNANRDETSNVVDQIGYETVGGTLARACDPSVPGMVHEVLRQSGLDWPEWDRGLGLEHRLGLEPVSFDVVVRWWQQLENAIGEGKPLITGLPPQFPPATSGVDVAPVSPSPAERGKAKVSKQEGAAPFEVAHQRVALRPRMLILGSLAARWEFWQMPGQGDTAEGTSHGQVAATVENRLHRLLLRRLRQGVPVVLVETSDPAEWPMHVLAALEASSESGRIL